jgi:hypothetical protein
MLALVRLSEIALFSEESLNDSFAPVYWDVAIRPTTPNSQFGPIGFG